MNQKDLEQLKLLSTFHYILAVLAALFACFPIIHLIIGIFFLVAGSENWNDGEAPPAFFGWIFIILASFFIVVGWIFAICIAFAGKFLARHIRYKYCFVVACISCLFMPFGTVLGVFTIVVLNRPSVKEIFGETLPEGISA